MAKSKYNKTAIHHLSRRLAVESGFLQQCLELSVVEIRSTGNRLDLDNGTVIRLRRLQRLCETFEVEVPIAQQLLALTARIAELERTIEHLKAAPRNSTVRNHPL